MEDCVKLRLARSIGVSNYNVQSLVNLLSYCRIPPAVNQVELSVYLQQRDLVKFCNTFGIGVTAYSSLVRGGQDVQLQFGSKADLFNDPVLIEIANSHKVSVAQVALNYLAKQNIVVLPKTEKTERLKQNFDILGFQLSAEENRRIQGLDKGIKTVDPKQVNKFLKN